jgi:hypothetical protein
MRRVLAITLLLAFVSPLVVPLCAATADPEASLPACCRSHGKHHCAMMHMMLMASSGPVFSAPACPRYPTAIHLPALATAMLTAVRPLSVVPMRAPAPPNPSPRRAFVFDPSANLNRGPPALPA